MAQARRVRGVHPASKELFEIPSATQLPKDLKISQCRFRSALGEFQQMARMEHALHVLGVHPASKELFKIPSAAQLPQDLEISQCRFWSALDELQQIAR